MKSIVTALVRSWNHERILSKDGKYEENTSFSYLDIHIYMGVHACVYILDTVVGQFLLQIAVWTSRATSLPSVIDLPT